MQFGVGDEPLLPGELPSRIYSIEEIGERLNRYYRAVDAIGPAVILGIGNILESVAEATTGPLRVSPAQADAIQQQYGPSRPFTGPGLPVPVSGSQSAQDPVTAQPASAAQATPQSAPSVGVQMPPMWRADP